MVEWRIYYSDFSTFANADGILHLPFGLWESAAPRGVVCAVTIDPNGVWGRFVLHSHEFYYRTPGRAVMCSEDLSLLRVHVPAITDDQIKRGGNAWREDWPQILHTATHDADFPSASPRRRSTDWSLEDPLRPNR